MTSATELFGFAWWEVLLGGAGTLAIFSFLYRENPIYRFFEHLYIGIATAVGTMATVEDFIWPQLLKPFLGLDRVIFPDGTLSKPYDERLLLYLIPMAFGMLYYCIYSKRYAWIAQLVIGFGLGLGGGLAFKGTFNELLPQLEDSFRPLYVTGDSWQTAWNWVFVVTLVTAMIYFFFTFKRKPGGAVERSAMTGRLLLMGCFGSFFGATIMARMALLVERLEFLIHTWLPQIVRTFGGA